MHKTIDLLAILFIHKNLVPNCGMWDNHDEWGKDEQNIYTAPDGRRVIVTAHQEYDHLTQIQHHTFHRVHRNWPTSPQESEGKTTRLALCYVFPEEMEALLFHNGFEILSHYGDWDRQALTESSPRMISVCQRRSSAL